MNNKGFTLIELLVVVLIIGILAAIALPQYMKAVEKSRASEAITILGNLANAEKIYEMAMNAYTDDLSALDITMPGVSTCQKAFSTNNFNFNVVSTPSNNYFLATATRNKSNDAYVINLGIRTDGSVTKWCTAAAATSVPPAGDSNYNIGGSNANVTAMCKSIANGNAKGRIQ